MPRKGRPPLDTAAVVRAAVDLANAEGFETLSLSRLAEKLGVQTPSLYNHIDGLRGLYRELALLSARALGDCLADAAIGKSGAQGVRALAQAYRAFIKDNPGLYAAGLRASRNRARAGEPAAALAALEAAEARVVQVVMAVLAAFDLHGEDALHAVRALRSVVHGFATLEVAGGFGLALDCDESFRRLVEMFVRGLGDGD